MKRIFNISLVFLMWVICMSVMPFTRKGPPAQKYQTRDHALDRLRIEVNSMENDYNRKTQEAYISTRTVLSSLNQNN